MDDVKKRKLLRTAILCTVIAIVTLALLLGTFAKYVTSGTYQDEARVAKWGLDVKGTTESLFEKEYSSDVYDQSLAARADDEWGEHKIIAPGTRGEANLVLVSVDGKAPEVMYDFDVDLKVVDSEDAELPFPVFSAVAELDQLPGWEWWYTADGVTRTFKTHADMETDLNTRLSKKNVAPNTLPSWLHSDELNQPIRVGWSWKFDDDGKKTYDEADTRLGNLAATGLIDGLTVKLEVKATQVLEENKNIHTVSFDTQGGSMNPPQQLIPDGGKVNSSIIENPGKIGFVFGGWYTNPTDPTTAYDFDEPVKASFILYAHWNVAIEKPNWNIDKHLVYDGEPFNVDDEQYWINYDKTKIEMTEESTKEAIDVGTYTVYFKPLDGYCWRSDGKTTPIHRTWTIDPAEAKITTDAIYCDGTTDPAIDASLKWNHNPQGMFNTAAEAEGGDVLYTVGSNADPTKCDASSTDINSITKTDKGTYYVFYKVLPDKNHTWPQDKWIGPKKIEIYTEGTAQITKNPTAADLTFEVDTDSSIKLQELCSDWGAAQNGEMRYSVTEIDSEPPLRYFTDDTSLITGGHAGTYYVWFYAYGNPGYDDSAVLKISVTIKQADRNAKLSVTKEDLIANIDGQKALGKANATFDTYNADDYTVTYKSNQTGVADASVTQGAAADIIPYAGGDASISFIITDNTGNYKDATVVEGVSVNNFAYHKIDDENLAVVGYIPFVTPARGTAVAIPNALPIPRNSNAPAEYYITEIGDGTHSIFDTSVPGRKGLTQVESVSVFDNCTALNAKAFNGTTFLASITLDTDQIKSIPADVFAGTRIIDSGAGASSVIKDTTGKYILCTNNYTDKILKIGGEIISIADAAFKKTGNNTTLKKVVVECNNDDMSNLIVGNNAFENCTALENFVVTADGDKDSVQYGSDVFKGAGHAAGKSGGNLVIAGGTATTASFTDAYSLRKWQAPTTADFAGPETWSSGKQYVYLTDNVVHRNKDPWYHQPTITINGGDFVIDLNDHNLDRNRSYGQDTVTAEGLAIVMNGGTLRIDNSASINDANNTNGRICNGFNYDRETDKGAYTAGALEIIAGTVNMVNGCFYHNDGCEGSAVAVYQNGTFNMYGGVFKDNHLTNYDPRPKNDEENDADQTNANPRAYAGGTIDVKAGATFNMYAGIVTANNSDGHCGGVYVIGSDLKGTFNMYGGTVSGNNCQADSGYGRDVYAYAVSANQCEVFHDTDSFIDYLSHRGTVILRGDGLVNHIDRIAP